MTHTNTQDNFVYFWYLAPSNWTVQGVKCCKYLKCSITSSRAFKNKNDFIGVQARCALQVHVLAIVV